ncbi:ATPase, T2SS/T4P/T4SS family, partial [Pseudomonas syringae pv. tagetis]
IPPIAQDGPNLSIRKFRKDMLKSADLESMQTIDQSIFEFFQEAVGNRSKIIVIRRTVTGKTTNHNELTQKNNIKQHLN